ncbi:Oidioi.mRNA.OKI2018_I69.XSR.g15632.t1.cds [Oikopleura dioica]|uniref:Oidioi.mRNA.OKI2018_I69.XSR.g15632.t1.cds n=1 Tax=Oikopleura dioica TaxID=34765 RepID=A0ABN7SJV6_OIKDI|nr:Oidioi.mRNA.OKI2018_I69.XSR.g15632.t1.cds [Oikopleura dioica]
MKAAIQGQIDTVRLLLAHGADHSITDPTRGMCAQGWAQYCNRHETASEIAEYHRRPSSVRLKSHRKGQQGLVLKIHKLVSCGCRSLKPGIIEVHCLG